MRSRGSWGFAGGLLVLLTVGSSGARVHAEESAQSAGPALARLDAQVTIDDLRRRAARLDPLLMGALAAARREELKLTARCFDRAVAELHGLARQLAYHAARLEQVHGVERERHLRALELLGTRLDYLASSVSRCGAEEAALRPGETRVETHIPNR